MCWLSIYSEMLTLNFNTLTMLSHPIWPVFSIDIQLFSSQYHLPSISVISNQLCPTQDTLDFPYLFNQIAFVRNLPMLEDVE